jgi:hypothetical protein
MTGIDLADNLLPKNPKLIGPIQCPRFATETQGHESVMFWMVISAIRHGQKNKRIIWLANGGTVLSTIARPTKRGKIMGWKRISMFACAVVTLAVGASRLIADDQRTNTNKGQEWAALAAKLGLSDQQREAIRKNHEECEKKAAPIEHQVWAQFHAEIDAIKQQLNEEQQGAFTDALKAMRHKELDAMANKLALNAEQKQQLQTICNEFETRFQKLAATREKGEQVHQQFQDLRHEFIAAVHPILNPEQQAKLPFIVEEEHQRWRDPSVRREHLKAVLDLLNVSADKREQIKTINESYEKQIQPLFTELGQIRKERREKMENQLTAEQREKLREMRKGYGDQQ